MAPIAQGLVERIYSDNNERRTLTLEIIQNRINICNECEHCQYNHCQRLGCSVWRFRETILSKIPACPLEKH